MAFDLIPTPKPMQIHVFQKAPVTQLVGKIDQVTKDHRIF